MSDEELTDEELVKALRDTYDLVKMWPEKQPDGFTNLLVLRNLVPDAADRIEALTAELTLAEQRGYANAMEAERKLHEDRIEELEAERDLATSALMHLERCAQVVSERGAATGPQWTRLTVAILKAREAMSKLPTPSPINEPRLVQSAPPSQN
jgi:hypothetical protein